MKQYLEGNWYKIVTPTGNAKRRVLYCVGREDHGLWFGNQSNKDGMRIFFWPFTAFQHLVLLPNKEVEEWIKAGKPGGTEAFEDYFC